MDARDLVFADLEEGRTDLTADVVDALKATLGDAPPEGDNLAMSIAYLMAAAVFLRAYANEDISFLGDYYELLTEAVALQARVLGEHPDSAVLLLPLNWHEEEE
jgi:hypothetical protein